jgi:hypothetical protein
MHIQEIVIDGFKSYATRTVVSGFDASFNAITGARRNCARERKRTRAQTADAPPAAYSLTPPPPPPPRRTRRPERLGQEQCARRHLLCAGHHQPVAGATKLCTPPRRRAAPRRRQNPFPLSRSRAFHAPLQVRAASLSDLVYKAGQGGVTKATVSIVFDNRDARVSPPGYEHCEARWPLRASVGLRGALLRASTLSRLCLFLLAPAPRRRRSR